MRETKIAAVDCVALLSYLGQGWASPNLSPSPSPRQVSVAIPMHPPFLLNPTHPTGSNEKENPHNKSSKQTATWVMPKKCFLQITSFLNPVLTLILQLISLGFAQTSTLKPPKRIFLYLYSQFKDKKRTSILRLWRIGNREHIENIPS